MTTGFTITKSPPVPSSPPSTVVRLDRAAAPQTDSQALWSAIRSATQAISWKHYLPFADYYMSQFVPPQTNVEALGNGRPNSVPFPGVEAYTLLKTVTEIFLMSSCGVNTNFGSSLEDTFPTREAFARHLAIREELDRAGLGSQQGVPQFTNAGLVQRWRDYTNRKQERSKSPDLPDTLPYYWLIRLKLKDLPIKRAHAGAALNCYGLLQEKLTNPCFLELIWSYWHEEGMLVQSANAISMRFQNRRSGPGRDPLGELELDPLRPLNNILWGYIQDEQHRLTIPRRAYEYVHHYGLSLTGKAVPAVQAADNRSKFLEAFHRLLNLCAIFFREDDDTTVIADGFPLLNALKEVHLLLTQGQHNQYGELPWNARLEMLMQEWLLARPEMREFLPGRTMVAYPEQWMDRVDSMKKLKGWTDTSVLHFRDLGAFGEQILLGVRFAPWNDINDRNEAANWARYWRAEIQGYTHAYRSVTGVDLSAELTAGRVDATPPTVLLRNRLAAQLRST